MRYLVFVIGFFTSLTTMAGGVTSSGGDSVAAEFTRTARHIAAILETEIEAGVSGKAFLNAVEKTTVVSQERVFLEGQERDAINEPSIKRIIVGRYRWLETANQIARRYMLVMHEYLNIMGIDDSKYQVSSKVFAANGKKRIEIVCSAFEDLTTYFGASYRLHYILYEDRELIVVKTSSGELPTPPLGQAIGSAVQLPDAAVGLLFVVNFGVLRNIQVPYSFTEKRTGPINGTIWDALADGKSSPLRSVKCESHQW